MPDIQLNVSIGDKTHILIVPEDSTLDYVMEQISKKYIPTVDPEQIELVHAGKMLSYGMQDKFGYPKTLSDLDIAHLSSLTIVMGLKGDRKLQIIVSIGEKKKPLLVEPETNLNSIIHHIHDKFLPKVDINDIIISFADQDFSLKSIKENNNGKMVTLKEMGVTFQSTLTVLINMLGGMFQYRSQIRYTHDASKPDMITYENDHLTPRAIMPCGHAITSESMIEYCRAEISQKKYQITCPECRDPWDWSLVSYVAQFEDQEKSKIEYSLSENFLMKSKGYFPCPGCKIWSQQLDTRTTIVRCANCSSRLKSYEFCCICFTLTDGTTSRCRSEFCDGTKGKLRILQNCPMKAIDKDLCPSTRVCPKCGLLIEHKEKCKHVTCKECLNQFCFICLVQWGNVKGHQNAKCSLASRQTVIPSQRTN